MNAPPRPEHLTSDVQGVGRSAHASGWMRIAIRLHFAVLLAFSVALRAAEPWKRHTIDASSRGADGVRLADVNGDGLRDIVTGWEQGGVTRVYVNPGHVRAREPWPAVTVGRTRSVEDAVFADLDGDGALDVVTSCEGNTRAMFIHWAPTKHDRYLDPEAWRTEPLPASTNVMMWMFCAPIQVDDSNGVDLIAGGKGEGAALGWFEAPADARKLADWKWHPLRPVGWVMSIHAHDLDGDGDMDIMFSDRKGKQTGCFWLEHPDRSTALTKPWKEHLIGLAGREVMFVRIADLDTDGREDVVACIAPSSLVWLRQLDGTPPRWEQRPLPVPALAGLPKAVCAGDLDLDGRVDVVFTCERAVAPKHGVWWLRNAGGAGVEAWEPRPLSGVDGVKHDLVELIDLDGDGDLDVLTCEETKNLGVFWCENPAR